MKPHIFFNNGRWHVFTRIDSGCGFLLRESAYAYAKAIWKRKQ